MFAGLGHFSQLSIKVWLVDSKVVETWYVQKGITSLHIHFLFASIWFSFLMQGLIVSSRKNSLQHFKKPWAHEHEPVNSLLEAVKVFNMSV